MVEIRHGAGPLLQIHGEENPRLLVQGTYSRAARQGGTVKICSGPEYAEANVGTQPSAVDRGVNVSPEPLHAVDNAVADNYSLSVKEIAYSRSAVRSLARMPRTTAGRIRDKIRGYASDPASQANNVSRLQGPDRLLRLRVGGWRVVMRDADRLEILHVTSRGSAYTE